MEKKTIEIAKEIREDGRKAFFYFLFFNPKKEGFVINGEKKLKQTRPKKLKISTY